MNPSEPELVPAPVHGPRVVVGVDGSPDSIAALHAGAWAAAMRGGTLVAVTAWGVPLIVPRAPVVIPDLRATAVQVLDGALADAFHGSALVPIEKVVKSGTAAEVLVEEAADAALVVVGSRGHGGFAGLLLGSVSMACAMRAPCPVLVMHHGDPLPPAARASARGRVVVGVGDGPGAAPVLQVAAQAAREMDSDLLAISTWNDVSFSGDAYVDFRSEVVDAARTHLDERIAEAFPTDRPSHLTTELREGGAVRILIEESRTADLVVVGRSGHRALAGVLTGSVCLPVAEHAVSPVLVVPAGTIGEDHMWAPVHHLTAAS
ncbi:MAG: universal stress protein [Acidobacteria bacterium]|nr:universal stress protein [Acidobacteriota bacterium]